MSNPAPTPSDHQIPSQQIEKLMARFRQKMTDFIDFEHPGAEFKRAELDHKRSILNYYANKLGNRAIRELVNKGQALKAWKEINKTFAQTGQDYVASFISFRSVAPSLGESEDQMSAILSAFLDVAERPFSGASDVEPIFEVTKSKGLKPSWDTLSTLLWLMRPTDYFPIKISYYRRLAREIGLEFPKSAPPTPETFMTVIQFGRAFWKALEPWKPTDWIDVQSFIWSVCPPKPSANEEVEDMEFESVTLKFESVQPKQSVHALNQILHGPPGAGKTYSTIQRAVEIVDESLPDTPAAIKERFDQLVCQRRISFVTFHQTFSYEDFVEGIRPIVDSEDGVARYECRDGLFKRLSLLALYDCLETKSSDDSWAFEGRWQALVDQIASEADREYESLSGQSKYRLFITARGNINARRVGEPSDLGLTFSRSNMQKVFNAHADKSEITTTLINETLGVGSHSSLGALLFREMKRVNPASETTRRVNSPNEGERIEAARQFLQDSQSSSYRLSENKPPKAFVLVIDEINRGNISKIFGELITLIESDKRVGRATALTVELPYSREKFGVPPNLHLLGTMNTADKSIALVDVALRRRFRFVELMPKYELIPEFCRDLVREINRRITLRKDRDHQIGHSYFMSAKDESSFNQVFRDCVLPLLQEYFFNDWEGLRFVLADDKAGDQGFIRKLEGGEVRDARNKWAWYHDLGANDLNPHQRLSSNYGLQ